IELAGAAEDVDVGEFTENVSPVALGHATDDADDDAGIFRFSPAQLAQARPDFLLGVLADGTGVVKDDIRMLAIVNRLIPLRAELAENELAVEHVHLAAEGFEVELFAHDVDANIL